MTNEHLTTEQTRAAQTVEDITGLGVSNHAKIVPLLDFDAESLVVAAMLQMGHRVNRESTGQCRHDEPHDCGNRVGIYENALSALLDAYESTPN